MTNPFKPGDRVKLRFDVLLRHSRSVPAHAGFTREQFRWRDILDKLEGKTGVVERIFPDSKHTNVKFSSGLIGIDWTELVKVGGVSLKRLTEAEYLRNKAKFHPTLKSRARAEAIAEKGKKKTIYVLPNGAFVVKK